MSFYRKKPVVIEAIQYNGSSDSLHEIRKFIGEDKFHPMTEESHSSKFKIVTLEGMMTADVGDYIIKGIHGEFYPCKPDIFEKTYERA